jgi:DNA-binding beta-propeller fold protein YncE
MILILRTYGSRLFLLFLPLSLLTLFSPPAFADGGAPQLAYVAGTSHNISVIDIAQQRVTNTIANISNPGMILLSPDGQSLYVTQPELGRMSVITAKTGKTQCTANLPGQPSLLALSLYATVLYVAGQEDTRVRAVNPATCDVQQTFETHQPIYGLALAASTLANATPSTPNQLWITGNTTLTVFEVNGHLLGTISIAGGPQYITIPGGFSAYITTRDGNVVAVDLSSRHVIRAMISGGAFGPMDYNANTGEIYVPDRLHNLLDVLTPVTAASNAVPKEPASILRLSGSPQSIAITSDGQLGFVALSNGQVVMLDIPGRSIVTSIAVGGAPHFIITGLYPPTTTTPSRSHHKTPPAQSFNNPILILSILLAAILLLSISWFIWKRRQMRPHL